MRIAYVTETVPPEIHGVSLTAGRTLRYLRRLHAMASGLAVVARALPGMAAQ